MKLVKYQPLIAGIRKLRGSREVDEMLDGRARLVATMAATIYRIRGEPIEVEVVQRGSDTRAPRARVAVVARSPKALYIEALQRPLGTALTHAAMATRVKGLRRLKRRMKVQGPKKPRAKRRPMARDPDEIHPDHPDR